MDGQSLLQCGGRQRLLPENGKKETPLSHIQPVILPGGRRGHQPQRGRRHNAHRSETGDSGAERQAGMGAQQSEEDPGSAPGWKAGEDAKDYHHTRDVPCRYNFFL